MDNQHKRRKGDRHLTPDEMLLINKAEQLAEEVGQFIEALSIGQPHLADIDVRWVNIARTQLQQGFMALIRGIARPTTF